MDKAALYQQVTLLIGQDELLEAATLLSNYWEANYPQLYQASLSQIRRLNTLQKKRLQGLVSEDDANVEHAKITEALIKLNNQLNKDHPTLPDGLGENVRPQFQKWWLIVALLALFIILSSPWWSPVPDLESAPFNLTINVQTKKDGAPIYDGKLKVILGDYHLPAKDLNSEGQVIFDEIPIKYFADTLTIVPIDMPYAVEDQSALIPKESQKITVNLVPRVEATIWRGTIVDSQKRRIAKAIIDIESGRARATSDENGNFQVSVPFSNNSSIQVVVLVDGENRKDLSYILNKDLPQTIILNDPK